MNFKASVKGVSRTEEIPYELLVMLGMIKENSQEAVLKNLETVK